jgi:thiamine thiazole synthase
MTLLEDIVIKEEKVCGAVVNWSPITSLPRQIAALDPVVMEAPVVIDATGHDATVVKKLEQRRLIETKGEGALWIEKSEDLTGEAYPGLIVTGMAVGTVYGLPRMGPTFGSMFVSGEVAAKVALEKLG